MPNTKRPGRPRKNPASPPKQSTNSTPVKRKTIEIDLPPFESPGKRQGKAPKRESSNKSSSKFLFERLGDGNMYIVWIEKPSGEAGYMQPIDDIIHANSKDGKAWREHTNCIAPLISRRKQREYNLPIPSKFKINLKQDETSYPWRCFFACKSSTIRHEDCILCVMKQAQKILDSKSTYTTRYIIDIKESDKTQNPDGPYRALDDVVLDKGVQTIICRYFYKDHLTDENWDLERNSYLLPKALTIDFVKQHASIARHFFTQCNDEYSFTARAFGYNKNAVVFNEPSEDEEEDGQSEDESPSATNDQDQEPTEQEQEEEED